MYLSDYAVIGLMGITNRGHCLGGVLVVVGHNSGAILPHVEPKSWVEYGPDRMNDRERVDVSTDRAEWLRKKGMLELCGTTYASATYTLTEKAWKFFLHIESCIKEYWTAQEAIEALDVKMDRTRPGSHDLTTAVPVLSSTCKDSD